jgi:hypothetical protein
VDAPVTAAGPSANVSPGYRPSGSVVAGIFIVLFAAVALGVAAYLKLTPHPVSIASVLRDLRTYDGTSVTVQGTVKETFNFAGVKWYQLEDPTGSIPVVTQRGLPAVGHYMLVTGIVNEVFNLGGINYTVLLEPQGPD